MALQWYVVQVLSGWEQKVQRGLEKRIKIENMDDKVAQILIPSENVSEVKSGKKTISKRKFFPGYVMLEMELTDEAWYLVTETPGVIGFAGEGKPAPLLDHEVDGILGQVEGKKEKIKPKISFDKGESVKVTDGPFVNFNGVVNDINPDRGKLNVMVTIFGRATPVELEYWQVEKI